MRRRRSDCIRKAYEFLCRRLGIAKPKPLKLLRKTAASLLAEQYDLSLVQLFLGHAPRTIAERHYLAVPQAKLDVAVVWLGSQILNEN